MPPWDKYAAPSVPQAPAFVVPPDPSRLAAQQAEEARKLRDQQIQEEANARAAAAATREATTYNATHNPDGTPKPNTDKPTKATEDENKSGAFYQRALRAVQSYDKQGLGPRSMVGQGIADLGGEGFLRALPDEIGDSSGRRISEQNKLEFASALLRSDSGANAPEPEVARLVDTYFPKPGETDPDILANYAAARKQALDALRARAGVLAKDLPSYSFGKDWGYDEENGLKGTVTDEGAPVAAMAATAGTPPPSGPGGPGNGFFTGDYSPRALMRGLAQGAGSLVSGVADIPGLLGGNLLGNGLYSALGYDQSYDMGDSAKNLLGLPDNPNPISAAIQRGGAGALTGAGAARGAAVLASSPTAVNVLGTLAENPLLQTAGGAMAGGAGAATREMGGGPVAQLGAAVAGGALGYGGASALARTRTPRLPSSVMAAADRQKIRMLPADVGGTGTRMMSGALGRTLGGVPMADSAERSLASAAAARTDAASRIGRISDETGAGQAAQRGARSFIANSERRGGDLFDNISVQSKALAETGNTRGALAEIVRGMESNPGLSKLWTGHPRLRSTLEALTAKETAADQQLALIEAGERLTAARQRVNSSTGDTNSAQEFDAAKKAYNEAAQRAKTPPQDGSFSWEDMKRLRTIVGQIVGKPGLSADGSDIAAMRNFYGALTSDMEATASAAGPRALSEFRRANQYWRGRQDRIDNVLSGVLGNDLQKGEAAAFEQINRWAQAKGGDFNRLSRTIRSLPEDEANEVRASIIGRMGQARPNQQNADGLQFSPATFSTQWASLSPRAKSTLFPNMTHRRDLDDIATVMDNMKRAGEFSNFSNTSLGTNLAAHAAGMMSAPITTILLTAGEFGLGKLLASPKFARWIATTPQNTGAMPRHIARLGTIAARDSSLAGDARQLQASLQEAFRASPGRAAADDEPDRRRVPPRN